MGDICKIAMPCNLKLSYSRPRIASMSTVAWSYTQLVTRQCIVIALGIETLCHEVITTM